MTRSFDLETRGWLLAALLALGSAACGDSSESGFGEEEPAAEDEYTPQFQNLPVVGPACSGKPGAKKGKSRETVQVGFDTRTFVYYAPPNLDPNKPTPLVIVPHGFTMSGEEMYGATNYPAIADREGFVAVFPDGKGALPWNVGQGINGFGAFVAGGHNDQGFIDQIIKTVEADRCLDKGHVFVTGFSMGGYFSSELACTRDDIAAIGPHSGGSHDLAACKGKIKPVILFHGDTDPLIFYENGKETRDRWVKRNGCSTAVDVVKVKGGSCEYNKNCPANGQVALCHFDLMGHAWAGGLGNGSSLFVDTSKESASELGWAFFKKYAW
jgi:polyhydroxybutyrate depolymerase